MTTVDENADELDDPRLLVNVFEAEEKSDREKKPEPHVPWLFSCSVAALTPVMVIAILKAMPDNGWLPSKTTCSGYTSVTV